MSCRLKKSLSSDFSRKKKATYPQRKEKQISTTLYVAMPHFKGKHQCNKRRWQYFHCVGDDSSPSWIELSFPSSLPDCCGGLELCQALLSHLLKALHQDTLHRRNFTFFRVWFCFQPRIKHMLAT